MRSYQAFLIFILFLLFTVGISSQDVHDWFGERFDWSDQ